MWIIKFPENKLPYLKLLNADATHWSEKLNEAWQFETKEEAESVVVRLGTATSSLFGKLVVEEYVTYAVKVHDAMESRNKIGRKVMAPGWLRVDPLNKGYAYLVPRLLDASLFETKEQAEDVGTLFVAQTPKHLGKAEIRRVVGSILKEKGFREGHKQRLRTGGV